MIGIFGQTREDVATLLDNVEVVNRKTIGSMRIYNVTYNGNSFYIIVTGVGKANVAFSLGYALTKLCIKKVIVVGNTASLESVTAPIGTVAIATNSIEWDVNFINLGYPANVVPGNNVSQYPTDASLQRLALESSTGLGYTTNTGLFASGDTFVASGAQSEQINTATRLFQRNIPCKERIPLFYQIANHSLLRTQAEIIADINTLRLPFLKVAIDSEITAQEDSLDIRIVCQAIFQALRHVLAEQSIIHLLALIIINFDQHFVLTRLDKMRHIIFNERLLQRGRSDFLHRHSVHRHAQRVRIFGKQNTFRGGRIHVKLVFQVQLTLVSALQHLVENTHMMERLAVRDAVRRIADIIDREEVFYVALNRKFFAQAQGRARNLRLRLFVAEIQQVRLPFVKMELGRQDRTLIFQNIVGAKRRRAFERKFDLRFIADVDGVQEISALAILAERRTHGRVFAARIALRRNDLVPRRICFQIIVIKFLSFKVGRLFVEQQHFTAVLHVFAEQFFARFVHRQRFREHHEIVRALSNDQAFAFHSRVSCHNRFVQQMERNLLARQGIHRIQKLYVQIAHRFI